MVDALGASRCLSSKSEYSGVGLEGVAGALTVGRVDGRQVQGQVAQRAVAGRRAGRARRLDDLQDHRLAVVAHRHLHAAETFRRRHACRAATVPRSGRKR